MRGEYKTPGGKLAGVRVERDEAGRWHCHVDGDFFIDGDDAEVRAVIEAMERRLEQCVCLVDSSIDADDERNQAVKQNVEHALTAILDNHPTIRLVGSSAGAIATAFVRAFGSGGTGTTAKPAEARSQLTAHTGVVHAGTVHPNPTVLPGRSDAAAQQWAQRWQDLCPHAVLDKPRTPEEQMATDMRWAREVAAGERQPTIRFWQWAAPCVVVGRFQSIRDEVHEDVAQARGMQVVRRCTGGGAMFIEPGNTITYSLYAPLAFVNGIGIAQSYQLCDYWLIQALQGLGLDARFSGLNDISSQHGKIGGAAQRRFPAPRNGGETAGGAVLHHVTLAYDIDAEAMGRVLNTSREKMRDKAVRSAVKRVDPLKRQTGMSRDALVEYLMESIRAFIR